MGQHSRVGDDFPDDHIEQPGEPVLLFGREPALILGLVASAIQLFSATVLPLSDGQQGVVNAVAVAVVGLVTAFAVSAEKAAPAVLGLVQAVLALALAFGLNLDAGVQGAVMAFATALVSAYVRSQVVAPVPAQTATV
jgi:nicotinamide riboside transporter PnuC